MVVLVEHEWGILGAFDEYLDAIRERRCRPAGTGYTITWVGMAGGEPRATLIRLELRIDGLRARPRPLFHGIATPPLWTLVRKAILGLYVARDRLNPESPLDDVWLIGRNPARAELRRVLTQVGVPRPRPSARRPSRRPLRRGKERGADPEAPTKTNHQQPELKETIMRDIATATVSGNLTRDAELKSLPSGTDVARLRVATTTRRKAGEEWVEKTNYLTVEVYGAQARSCAQYLRKGSRVLVDAELDWREWTDQQDNKREAVTLRARQVVFEGGRPASSADEDAREHGAAPDGAGQAGPEPVGVTSAEAGSSASAEDLPF